MAQNITLMGASYSAVPSVNLPKTGGGTASFTDVTDTTASASDVASGKYFYAADGTRTLGTASGGGGGWTKIVNTTELTVSYSSTTAASATTINLGATYLNKETIIFVRIRDKSGKRNGYFYGSDAYFMNYTKANGISGSISSPALNVIRYNSGYVVTTSQYGLYGYQISSEGVLTIRKRYSSSYSLTIDSTYTIDAYALTPPLAPFV